MAKLFLIGYMGSGKTTTGKKLASKLNFEFIDLDTFIETEYKKTIPDIFKQEGEEAFRSKENNALKKLLAKNNIVIACGGGTPCYYNNMELINNNGISVYLKLSIDSIVSRLLNAKDKRPLIDGKSENELKSFVMRQLEKRERVYNKAKYTVKAKDLDIEELTKFLKSELV
jgi:shikimate kinase